MLHRCFRPQNHTFLPKGYVHFLSDFFEKNQMINFICTLEILKLAIKTSFSVHKIQLYLCGQVENTQWILCCQKIGVKCTYLRFLMYKTY